ncbi:flagellar M-ring protein FliF [Paenibacillus sp. IB182496]|uniref:Flagellar M-ring protein n=1 Tax=Paenibacillus sabuli TaxID=2772509 RepID=A0A927BR98_9BACL|nr:flagellar basal-body MS-ring/collar protein FliF [Paenibacillus sabuli]MBD2845291.1 flagellar M-ring protein FliF [Paenibacillus sabuli]
MKEKFAQYRERGAQYWNQFGKTQKIVFIATIGILLLTAILLIMIFSRTEYELAFQDLNSADASAIIEHLEASGIPYKLGGAGTTISVPAADASRVKVDVGSQGLVQNGSIGFDAFGDSSSMFGRTDNEFDVMYRNALNGEIQGLLNSMQGVQRSNVIVNLPKESVFVNISEAERASASVVITFKPGFRPTQSEIDGYFNLVKTSVPNLGVEDITMTSQEGDLFASSEITGNSSGTSQGVEAQFQIQRKYESEIRRNIQQFLGSFYGSENVVISVASSLNFDQKSTQEMLVQPLADNNNNGIIISESETSSISSGSQGQVGGVAGTGETDVPGYQATDGATSSSSEETSRTRNYEVSRITNEIVSGPFVVKDLSISVGIPLTASAADVGTGTEGGSGSTEDQLTAWLTSLVRSQLADSGQNVNDAELMKQKVTVIAQPSVTSQPSVSVAGLSWPWAIGIGLGILALGGGAAYVVMRRRKQARLEEETELLETQAKVEYPTIDLDNMSNENQARKQLEQLAKKKPEEFVNLLRTWLVDE